MVVSVYFLVILILAARLAFDGEILSGLALAGGVLLAMGGGGGARVSWMLGRRKAAVVIGLILLFIGMEVANWAGVTYEVGGFGFCPDLWAFVGSVLAFFDTPDHPRAPSVGPKAGDGSD